MTRRTSWIVVEAVARRVKVSGQEKICKRGVSVDFPGTFS